MKYLIILLVSVAFGFQEGGTTCTNDRRMTTHPCNCARANHCTNGKPADPDESRMKPGMKCFNDCRKDQCRCSLPCGS